jgi:signal transduction histidine kinase
MRARIVLVSVGAVGIAVAVAVASQGRMGAGSTAALLGWTVGGAVVTAGIAATLLWLLRKREVTLQVTVASLAPVVAVAAGIAGGSWAMFISGHDLRTLVVILVGAGTVGIITALLFGSRISRASAGLGELARSIGRDDEFVSSASIAHQKPSDGPGELARLARDLDAAVSRLAESRAEAVALEQSRRELVAWVSHDLRTPLAGIRAMVEALEDGVVDDAETIDRYHRTIGVEVDRLASLVADLFELSRIHAGALQLKLAPVALDEVLSDVVAGATLLARAKGVELTTSLADSPVVSLAVTEMGRAVQNLIDNAIRHTPPGGTIRVEVASDPRSGCALVSVADSCGGIPDNDLDRVFELAYSGDVARTPGDGRAGLGLAVTRGLVEAQLGRVSVLNEEGGCRFTISLPLANIRAGQLHAGQNRAGQLSAGQLSARQNPPTRADAGPRERD